MRAAKSKKAKSGSASWEDLVTIKSLKKRIKSRIRSAIKRHDATTFAKGNPRKSWKFIRKMSFTESKSHSSSLDLEAINEYFGSVVGESGPSNPNLPSQFIQVQNDQLFNIPTLSVNRTLALLRQINAHGATGSDGLPGFLIKNLAPFIAPNLTLLFNRSISLGVYPASCKRANVGAIYKNKGPKTSPESFSPGKKSTMVKNTKVFWGCKLTI